MNEELHYQWMDVRDAVLLDIGYVFLQISRFFLWLAAKVELPVVIRASDRLTWRAEIESALDDDLGEKDYR